MTNWKNHLDGLLPQHAHEWIDEQSIYLTFSTLLSVLGRAVASKNYQIIKVIFEFAQWCFDQDQKDLWNSAGVSFYEHLADDPSIEAIVHLYLKRDTFEEICSLIELVSGTDAVSRIRDRYGRA